MNETVSQDSTVDRSAHVQLKPATLVGLPSGGETAAVGMDLDRELIAAGQEYATLEDEFNVVVRAANRVEGKPKWAVLQARLDVITDRQDEIRDMMLEATPRTAEGLRAMALAALSWAGGSSTAAEPINHEEQLSFTVLLHILDRA